jgi:hypothetical protein
VRIALLFILLTQLSSAPRGLVIEVPHAPAPVIDGSLDKDEWAGAASDRLSDGSIIRFQHDAEHLFVAIEAATSGFPSLCVAIGDTVRVLHASAALGSVTYSRAGRDWTSADKAFVYGMRNPAVSDAARAERQSYLKDQGWLSTTVPMTKGRAQEMQISFAVTGRTPRIALGYLIIGSGDPLLISTWPRSMSAADGCAESRLVSGYVPSPLSFETDGWATLRLR